MIAPIIKRVTEVRMRLQQKKANIILLAGVLFNFTIGVLFAWSVIKSRLTAPLAEGGWGWTSRQAGLPYTIAIICFALGMLIGGRMQDKIGPRKVLTVGGVMVGLGLVCAGLAGNSPALLTLSFGVITGLGSGCGYGCLTPPALKWFHPGKKGLVSGLIIGGFSMATVYLAPLANTLLNSYGIEKTFIFLGVAIIVISVPLAQLIKNPPPGYVPAQMQNVKTAAKSAPPQDFTWKEMMKTRRFYYMFIMLLIAASVGLMIIGNISKIAAIQAGVSDTAFLAALVAFLAITNSAGRVLGGLMSDKIGRVNALFVVFILQGLNMLGFLFYYNVATLIIGIILVGFCYGTLLSVLPALTTDQYGLKNFGANYGVIFLGWGLAGVAAPLIADIIYDTHASYHTAYIICAVMMAAMVLVNMLLKADLASNSSKFLI